MEEGAQFSHSVERNSPFIGVGADRLLAQGVVAAMPIISSRASFMLGHVMTTVQVCVRQSAFSKRVLGEKAACNDSCSCASI